MKKTYKISAILIAIVVFMIAINVEVSTKRGVNYRLELVNMPLYLKVLDFFDRHYNYINLVKSITLGAKDEEIRALRIFDWTCKNVRKIPEGFPIIDDHTWNIITRGYGTNDQCSDVFATLCNYAGLKALYHYVHTNSGAKKIPLAFVNIKGSWSVFYPYEGISFINSHGTTASIEDIKSGDWRMESRAPVKKEKFSFEDYIPDLSNPQYSGLDKASIQSPVKRFAYQIRKVFSAR